MSFEVHPILEPGHLPAAGAWYALSPEGSRAQAPPPKVGACANFLRRGDDAGSVVVSAGATPEGPYADLHQLSLQKGLYFHLKCTTTILWATL